MTRRTILTLAVLLLPAIAGGQPNPYALESDARPRVAAGRIVTDAISDTTGQLAQGVRVFGWQFGVVPGDPYFIQEPGFNATAASGLPPGSLLGFRVSRGLYHWSGQAGGRVDFSAPAPGGAAIGFNFGAGTVSISGASGPQAGFGFATVSSSGGLHRHLNAYLSTAAGGTPASGAYLATIQLTNTGGPLDGDPLMLLFGNGLPTPELQRALAYVANPLDGDADFSGRTDIADFAVLASNFNAAGERYWFDGDFTGDRTVGIGDFSLLAATFNQVAPAARMPAARMPAAVPEPAALAGVAILVLGLVRRG